MFWIDHVGLVVRNMPESIAFYTKLFGDGPIDRVVMESSGHYWFSLAAALHRQAVPVAVVNPVSAKNFGKRRLQRTKSDPADARTLAALGMADQPRIREPLAGAELREAARSLPLAP